MWENKFRTRHPVGPTVGIANWYLRQFSDRPSIDLRAVAGIIIDSKFDIVAVQEVKKHGEAVDKLLNVLGVPWRATSLSPMTGNSERFVFIYNGDHVQEIGRPRFIDTSDASTFDRAPYQQSFRAGQFDFTLVSAHLSYSDTSRRAREAAALARYARELAAKSSEKDVIVLGDFNEEGRGSLHYFDEQNWERLIRVPTNLNSKETFDNILIDPRYTREWSGASGAIPFDETRFGNNDKRASDEVSDHRPAYADFVTNLRDDD